MSQIHQLFAAVIAVCVAAAVTPASAQAKSADRQISATADAVQHSDSATTDKLNRENLRPAQSGKTLVLPNPQPVRIRQRRSRGAPRIGRSDGPLPFEERALPKQKKQQAVSQKNRDRPPLVTCRGCPTQEKALLQSRPHHLDGGRPGIQSGTPDIGVIPIFQIPHQASGRVLRRSIVHFKGGAP